MITKKGERCRKTVASGYYKCGIHKDHPYTYECGIFPLEIWDILYKHLSPASLGNVMLSSFIHHYRISNVWLEKNPYYLLGESNGKVIAWLWTCGDTSKYKIRYDSSGVAIFFKGESIYPPLRANVISREAALLGNLVHKIDSGAALTHALNKKLTVSIFKRYAPPSDKSVEKFILTNICNYIKNIIAISPPGISTYCHKALSSYQSTSFARYIIMNDHLDLVKRIARELKEVYPNLFINTTTHGDIVYCKEGITSL